MSLLVFAFCLVIFGININTFPLKNWDEAWYAEIIKNLTSGNYSYWIPFWNGQYFLDKPPLYFWLTLPVVNLFGIGHWQVRLISVIAASLTGYLIFRFVKKNSTLAAAWLATLIYLSLGHVVDRMSHGNLDGLLVFLLFAAIYLFIKNKTIISGLFLGLAFLTKGWLVCMIVPLWCFIYLVTSKQLSQILRLFVLLSVAVFVFSLWLLMGYSVFKTPFVSWYVFNPSSNNLLSHQSHFSKTLLISLIKDIGVWWVLLLPGVLTIRRNLPFVLSSLLSSLIFVIALSFLREKFGWYNLPIYPLIAISLSLVSLPLLHKKYASILIFVLLLLQIIWLNHLLPYDRSADSASVGEYLNGKLPQGVSLSIDDLDFTTILYYSDVKTLTVYSHTGGKPFEYWHKSFSEPITSDYFLSRFNYQPTGYNLVTKFNQYTLYKIN